MASQSTLSVCNLSLLSVGCRAQLSSVNPSDGSAQSDACSQLYTFVYESLARAAWWNCFRAQATLTLLAAAIGTPENQTGTELPLPPQPWAYQYAVPANSLKCRYLIPLCPNTQTTNGGTVPFTTANNGMPVWIRGARAIPFVVAYATDASNNPIEVILTNLSMAQLIYTVNQPNPQIWDSQFTQAFVAALAAYLVPALTLNMGLMSAQIGIADKIIMAARASDANEGPINQDHLPDWMRARAGGGGYGASVGPIPGFGYSEMSWPSTG